MSVAKNGQNPQFTIEEISAIVATAKDYGMLTAAHAHGDEGMRRAVIAGIKTIEHGTLMKEATMDLMVKHNAYLVPEIGPVSQITFGKAYKKGVSIAFGTDAGVSPHGENGKEFAFMHEAGMPIMQTIQAATVTNADLLGMADELGKLKEGKNVHTLENAIFVMKEGVIYKQ